MPESLKMGTRAWIALIACLLLSAPAAEAILIQPATAKGIGGALTSSLLAGSKNIKKAASEMKPITPAITQKKPLYYTTAKNTNPPGWISGKLKIDAKPSSEQTLTQERLTKSNIKTQNKIAKVIARKTDHHFDTGLLRID